jgi:allantoicase
MIPAQDCIDLASELLGGAAVAASDEFFAPKENLVKTSPPVLILDKYTEFGKWMDGWESRRRRTPGHDWCVIRLGLSGILRGVDVDTSHFTGNFPSHCSLERCSVPDGNWAQAQWSLALPQVRLHGGTHNVFDIEDGQRCTHVRLNIFPDGGVARLRVYGDVVPDFNALARSTEPVDFASVANGGLVLACSDMYFGSKNNLIMPGKPANMGGGWETRRRRGPGYDWIIVRLGARCHVERVAVETEHFKGNYPDRCSLDACNAEPTLAEDLVAGKGGWQEILAPVKLKPDAVHQYQAELSNRGPFTHVRLNIYPDGGVSRLRVYGRIPR